MIIIAIILFAFAAILGLFLLTYVLQGKETPKGVAFTHGPLAAIGLIVLIVYAILYSPAPIISIVIFILAALGGFMMIFRDLSGKSVPKWLAAGHGIVAVVGFVFLIYFFLK